MKVYKIKPKNSFVGIKKYNISKNKICISRKCGGYGDILVARMIFEDIKNTNPDFDITFALPTTFHQIVLDHPFIDSVKDCNEINHDDYISSYDISTVCSGYEATQRKKLDKHRSDIWAESIGIKLKNHNMHLPHFEKYKNQIFENWKKLGYKEGQKIVAFSPRSAVQIRNLTDDAVLHILKKLKRDDIFIYIINHIPIIDYMHIPYCKGSNLIEAMSLIDFSDGLISTDTGTLHCGGGYNKPILGIFNYTNGEIIGKYYENLVVVQKNQKDDPSWTCGPCNDFAKCPYEITNYILRCSKEISHQMLDNGIDKFLQKLDLSN